MLSEKAKEVHEKVLTDAEYDLKPEDYEFKITEEGTFLLKDFCIVCRLNEFQDYIRRGLCKDRQLPIPDDIYNWLSDYGQFLEYVLGVCDGREDKE